jgi:hypothetical protein
MRIFQLIPSLLQSSSPFLHQYDHHLPLSPLSHMKNQEDHFLALNISYDLRFEKIENSLGKGEAILNFSYATSTIL